MHLHRKQREECNKHVQNIKNSLSNSTLSNKVVLYTFGIRSCKLNCIQIVESVHAIIYKCPYAQESMFKGKYHYTIEAFNLHETLYASK